MEIVEEKPLIKKKEHVEAKDLSSFDHFKQSLHLMAKSEKSLIFMFIINFLVSLQYYILVTLIPLYFSNEHGFSDLASGIIFGGFGTVIGICSIYLSSNMHVIGFKRGLYLSFITGIIGFGIMMINMTYLSLFAVHVIQAISCSLSWPFVEYGIKEFSTKEVRSISSSCFFISNYAAGITAGVFIDFLWYFMTDHSLMYFIVYAIGILALFIGIIFTLYCRDIDKIEQEDFSFKQVSSQKRFWRYCSLIFLLILLRSTCFGHLDATLPKYMVRVMDDNAHFGVMLTIHSITMMIGVFSLTTLSFKFSSYSLIISGGLIGALGSSLLIFEDEMWAFVVFVMAISIGESIWVPRLLDYTYSIAPEGQEGVYLAMSNCPFYFGMIITGSTSGLMLDNFCPKDDTDNCHLIWLVVFSSSVVIPLILVVFSRLIKQPDDEKEPYLACVNREKVG